MVTTYLEQTIQIIQNEEIDFDELPSKTASTNSLFTIIDHDPPWMNDFVKNKMKWKHQIHKTYKKMVTHTVTISSFKKQLVSFLN